MLWIDLKFANLIGSELEQFRVVSNHPYIANYRCFICGDSEKKKRKSRGYLLEKDNKIFSYCHNCGYHSSLGSLLKEKSPRLFSDYRLESLKERGVHLKPPKKNITFTATKFKPHQLNLGPSLCNCTYDDALKYAQMRMIPEKFYNSIHFNSSLLNITKQIKRYEELDIDSKPVLVIPFYSKDRDYSHICCRSIDKKSFLRYIMLEVDDILPNLWGLEFVDWTKAVHIFEGPIDAMCVSNSLAIGGSVGTNSIDYIKQHINNLKDVCFVYDNDMKSNIQIQKQVQKRMNEGFSVFIPDKQIDGIKDVNEIITKQVLSFNDLSCYIQERTFSGLRAKVEFAKLLKKK